MLQKEFEERIGRSVEGKEFEEAHRIYMACGEMDKDAFCRLYPTKDGKQLLLAVMANELGVKEKAYRQTVEAKDRAIAEAKDRVSDAADVLLGKACAYDDTDLYDMAVSMIGRKNAVMRKIEMGLPLWDEDKELLKASLALAGDKE